MKRILFCTLICCLSAFFVISCAKKQAHTPKPKGYFRIEMPAHDYEKLDTSVLPFTFQCSKTVAWEYHDQDTVKWLLLNYPGQKARLELSLFPIHGAPHELMLKDKEFVEMHFVKADNVENSDIYDSVANVYGIFTDIEGREVACPFHFWLSDMKHNYLRGTLYFDFSPNNDSVQPVINYIREDAMKLIETFEWR